MDCKFSLRSLYPTLPLESKFSKMNLVAYSNTRIHVRKPSGKLRSQRRSKLPPDFGVNLFLKKPTTVTDTSQTDSLQEDDGDLTEEEEDEEDTDVVWESDEIEAISSLFRRRIPQKPGKLNRERPLPLPLPHKLRPLGFPTPKKHVKMAAPNVFSSRTSISNQVYKNPIFLVCLAKKIKNLNPNEDVSVVLDDCAHFLRKGSLSLTIRELGHMDLPRQALQTFCWAQKQPQLFPDDRILASTVEVLARNNNMKVPLDLHKFASLASPSVIEAMVRGLIRGGSLELAWKVVLVAKDCDRILDASLHAKLILELGKNQDTHVLAADILDDLGEREDLYLSQHDCNAIMKVCIKLGKFDIVEGLFNWFKQSTDQIPVAMYTTLIHSRYYEKRYRDALAVVWQMEGTNCLLDLPAYRVIMKLFVALNDLSRAVRYFSKLKEAGFSPTYDIYRNLITGYMSSGRLAKCKEIWKEAEEAGFIVDKQTMSELVQLESETKLGF